jgi:hypothetical protein
LKFFSLPVKERALFVGSLLRGLNTTVSASAIDTKARSGKTLTTATGIKQGYNNF